jgi:adenylosuccinate synthase
MINGATQAAVTKLDILFPACKGAKSFDELTKEAKQFIADIENHTGIPVVFIGTGQEALDIIDRRK